MLLAQAIPLPNLDGQSPLVVGFVVAASILFTAYALYKQIASSRLDELDTVVDRVSSENERLVLRVDAAEQREHDTRKELEGVKADLRDRASSYEALEQDFRHCMAAREEDRKIIDDLRRRVEGLEHD